MGMELPISTMAAYTCTAEQKELGCHDLPERPITITTTSSAGNIARAELSKAYYEAVGFKVEMDIGGGDEAKRTFVTKEASFSLRGFGLRPHPSAPNPSPRHPRRGAAPSAASPCRGCAGASRSASSRRNTPPQS